MAPKNTPCRRYSRWEYTGRDRKYEHPAEEMVGDFEGRGLTQVIHVFLVRNPKQEHSSAIEALLMFIENFGGPRDDIRGHRVVDLPSQLDEARCKIVFFGFPFQIERI